MYRCFVYSVLWRTYSSFNKMLLYWLERNEVVFLWFRTDCKHVASCDKHIVCGMINGGQSVRSETEFIFPNIVQYFGTSYDKRIVCSIRCCSIFVLRKKMVFFLMTELSHLLLFRIFYGENWCDSGRVACQQVRRGDNNRWIMADAVCAWLGYFGSSFMLFWPFLLLQKMR